VRNKNLAASKRKRRKITEEKSRGRANADLYDDQALFEEKIEASRLPDMQPQTYNEESDDSSALSYSSEDEDELLFKVEALDGLSLFIRAFSQIEEGEAALLLQDLQPDTVILYDSDASFIRTLEIYANTMASTSEDEKRRLQVFFLLYESCAEEISFTKTLERETEAFNRLIDYKKRLPSLVSAFNTFSTQEMQQSHGGVGGSYAGGTLPLSMDTRTGRGKQNVSKERRDIAVDVREFRAKLPSVLHQGGMRLAPATLVVGDYILSDVHCVERKSISDFYQSMDNSSRLKEQAEKMVKYYKIPILLLEFDPEKTFQLQNPNELGGEIKKNSITSKLCILVTAFPMLRILWSRSPHETLKVFKKLKCNHQEVNVDKAIEIGTNDAMDELLGGGPGGCYNEDDDDEGDGANEAAVQMLLRLPGVTSHNARNIIKECDSIAELAEMSREKLKLLAGQKAGQKLFTFFRQPFSG
jgi:DNA excision repair protein ERCC-4